MKLSDIKGERAIDVIADLIEPVAHIAEDEKAAKLFRREKLPNGESAKSFLLKRIRTSVPALLRGHKDDLIEIMSAIEGVGKENYAASLTIPKLIADIHELFNDSELLALFGLAQTTEEPSSGAAQADTQAAEA
nr:MAG TPA: hypothetical protein [Caudoviricetes sp.]